MTLNTQRVHIFLFCIATSLLPVYALGLWMDNYLTDYGFIVMLLAFAVLTLGLDWALFAWTRPAVQQHTNIETDTLCPSAFFQSATKNKISLYARETLRLYPKAIIVSSLLMLATRWNLFIFSLLIGLAVVDVISYKRLRTELIRRSLDIQNQEGWQGRISIANRSRSNSRIKLSPFKLNGFPDDVKFMETVNMVARVAIIVLAVYSYIVLDFLPLYAMAYCLLPRLFFLSLRQAIHGNLSKQIIIDSLYFVKHVESTMNAGEIEP